MSGASATHSASQNESILPEVKLLLKMQKICPSTRFFKKSKKNQKKTKKTDISKIKPKSKKGDKLIISIPLNMMKNEVSQDVRSQKSSCVVSLHF